MPDAAHVKPLTALRFFAAFWVVLYHYWPNLDVGFTPAVAAKGYLGVEAFFVLSGFILCHVYLAGFGEGRFRYGDFLWNRLARVYPLHLATLVGVGGMALAGTLAGLAVDANILSWPSLPANLLLVHAWGLAPVAGWNHASWSISAEWFAYLTFPAFAFVVWRMRNRPAVAVGLAAVFALGVYAVFERLAGFSLTEATFRWGALRIVPCFLLGCALYLVHRRGPIPFAGPVALVSGLAVLASASLGLWDPITVLCAGGLILGLGSLSNARAGVLGSKVGVYLGEISYSIYMVCAPALLVSTNLAARLTGADDKRFHVIVWLAVVAAIPVAAVMTYHLVERPARKALRGLAARNGSAGPATKAHGESPERVLQPSKTIV